MVRNLAFSGLHVDASPGAGVERVMRRAEEVARRSDVSKLVIWVGTNDLWPRHPQTKKPVRKGRAPKLVAKLLFRRLKELRLRHPAVELLVVGALPRLAKALGNDPHRRTFATFAIFNVFLNDWIRYFNVVYELSHVDHWSVTSC
jgi:hypothetical protein